MPLITAGNSVSSTAQIVDGIVENADLADGAVDNAKVASDAAIVYSKLDLTSGVVNSDVSASAAIVDTKLATISTAGKVSSAALTNLASIPSGAGVIPAANLPGFTAATGQTTRAGSTASGDQTIAHGLGKTPFLVRITAAAIVDTGARGALSIGSYDGTTQQCIYKSDDGGNGNTTFIAEGSSSHIIRLYRKRAGSTGDQSATIAVDGTNITLSWTKTSNDIAGTMYIAWEALA